MEKEIILFSESIQFLNLTEKYIKSYGISVSKSISNFREIEELPKSDKKKLFIIKLKENGQNEYIFDYLKENKINWISVSPNSILNFEAIKGGAIEQIIIRETPTIDEYKIFLKILSKKILKAFDEISKNYDNLKKENKAYDKVIAIGASTGGTEAIEKILLGLEADVPPILIVLHMPPVFTAMYAKRLNEICKMNVKEAEDGDILTPGLAIIAPGGYQMKVKKDSVGYIVSCQKEGKVNGHEPSVDVLFNSVADYLTPNVIATILTGMGNDGAKGILKIKQKGGYTIGQDKESSVVYGMPKVAYEIGGILKQSPLDNISKIINDELNK